MAFIGRTILEITVRWRWHVGAGALRQVSVMCMVKTALTAHVPQMSPVHPACRVSSPCFQFHSAISNIAYQKVSSLHSMLMIRSMFIGLHQFFVEWIRLQ